ncbi:MAG: PAS domain-containing protein [Thermacetogeniaceae bacterium]
MDDPENRKHEAMVHLDEAKGLTDHFLTAVMNTMPAGVSIATDVTCTNIRHNPVAADFLRIHPWDSLSHSGINPPALKLYHQGKELTPEEMPMQLAAWKGIEVKDFEMEFVWDDGTHKTSLWNAVPLFDDLGGITGAVATFKDITEQKQIEAEHKQAEKELQESKERLSALYFSMTEGLALHEIIYDKTGKPIDYLIMDVNPAYERIMDLKKDWAVGKKASELYGTGEAPYLDTYAKVASTGDPASFETYFPPMKKHFSISAFSPQKGRFATVCRDMTVKKRAEDEHENQLRLIVDSLPSCVSYLDSQLRYVFVNKAYEAWFGHPMQDLLGKYTWEVIGEEAYHEVQGYMETALSGERVAFELELPYKDGGTRFIYGLYVPDIDEHGIVKGFIGLTNDMAEFKEMERKIAEALEFNQRILESSPQGINTFDSSGQCVFANDASAEICGGTKEQILQQNFNLLESWKQTGLLDMAKRVLETGITERKQIHIKTIFGKELWLDHRLGRFNSGGEPHLLLVFDDVTERRQAEEEIRKLNMDLIRRAEELTHINKELESFSYSVSHDLRSPLRSINGFSNIILNRYQDKLDETGKEYLQIIRSECNRMGNLIDGLLNLSRMSRKELNREEVDMSAMAENLATELHGRVPERQVDFIIAPGIKAYGDKVLLQSVLENLINNAWKFTGKHPQATIEFGSTGHEGKQVFFVRDDGAGFDMKYTDKLFGTFQRLHAVDEFPGNGIGLAIIQRIIHRHGGQVWAEGAIEKGATFYFTLE